jgi:hypothetical protein
MFQVIREGLRGSGIEIVEREDAVNNEGFATAIAEALVGKMGLKKEE